MTDAEDAPPSEERKIPKFLYITYVILFIGGIWAFVTFWNGSKGWFDRGHWHALQQAAQTTFPFEKKEPYLEGQ